MFKSVASRSASAYQRVSLETSINTSNPQQMVLMLFDGLLLSLKMAQTAMDRDDMAGKNERLYQAVRILNEGLIPSLDLDLGGVMASNLNRFYNYCSRKLIYATLRDDASAVAMAEVVGLIQPLTQAWKRAVNEPAAASI